jgi:hypothetical protein
MEKYEEQVIEVLCNTPFGSMKSRMEDPKEYERCIKKIRVRK